mmetsp:Transcript_6992/g.16227  ORF Transcript_6992/g.16227 Transcript_6992/m.16227 type:complete len:826 (-) Transcript_6992:326-2803(-)
MSTPKSQKSLRGSDLYERALNIKQSTVIDKKGKETVNDEAFLKAAKVLMEEPSKKGKSEHDQLQIFTKVCRSGAKRKTRVVLSHAHDWVIWDHTGAFSFIKNRHSNRMEVAHIVRVEKGQENIGFLPAKNGKSLNDSDEILERAFVLVGQDRSLKLICPTVAVCKLWYRACTEMVRQINAAPKGNPFFQYLRDQWNRADTDRSGSLNTKEVMQIMKKMNVTKSKKEIQAEIELFDDDRSGQLEYKEYEELMKKIFSDRPEIKKIIMDMQRSTGGEGHGGDEAVSLKMLHNFLNVTQRAGRATEAEVTEEECKQKIKEITQQEDATELSLMEFAMLLDSGENSVFDEVKASLGAGTEEQFYMSRPLSHYWINSSHNTYLAGDQLKGHSSAEQYTYVLQRGCRCVELDCWDGEKDDEPIITHGHTLCTKISFRSVVETIAKNAFGPPANNPYPVILSIEMHCSIKYQKKMWEICKQYFGDQLLLLPDNENAMEELPSPWELKHKILVKGKRLKPEMIHSSQAQEVSDSSSDDDEPGAVGSVAKSKGSREGAEQLKAPAKKEKKKVTLEQNWSTLVYLAAVHFKSFDLPGKPFEMSSYSEKKCKKMCGDEASRLRFVHHNFRQLSRVYPFGGRIDSSNLHPINAWASGCQLVALNFQTGDVPMQLNYGKFIENGNTGYVLKPPYMRETGVRACEVNLEVRVLSCQRLPNNNASRDIVDPYVRVEVYGVDEDEKLNEKTRVIDNNGFNPVFNDKGEKTMSFTIRSRENAMLRISVLDQDVGQDDFIGQFCLPVTCIRNGYRHVPLYDANNGTVHSAGVLCWFSQTPRTT